MEIKICGITSIDEVGYINKLKPEYIGFVFTKSKRQISKKQGAVLSELVSKEVKIVAVFKDNSLIEIEDILSTIKVDVIQLHGSENSEFIEEVKNIKGKNKILSNKNLQIWKGVSVKSEEDLKRAINFKVDRIILDGLKPGSGKMFNWRLINEFNLSLEFFLAGGISINNIDEIIKNIRPYGVDISSGAEGIDELGNIKKDFNKIKKIIEKVRK